MSIYEALALKADQGSAHTKSVAETIFARWSKRPLGRVSASSSRQLLPLAVRGNKWLLCFLLAVIPHVCGAQDLPNAPSAVQAVPFKEPLDVNWIYGAYIPKEDVREHLTGSQQLHLYVRQSFTTPGIYVKTGFFAVTGQIKGDPPGWDSDFGGFAKRLGTNYAQNLIQNSVRSLGDGMLGWEPRYDRCKCSGFWPRSGHAVVRNFVTYDRSEKHLRPQIFPFLGAFSGSAVSATWMPYRPDPIVKGYQGVIGQAWFGSLTNLLGEFAPDVMKKIKRHKK
jgi:hypothetical protein